MKYLFRSTSVCFIFVTLYLVDANRWEGGGGNRRKQGGFNSWRQQNFNSRGGNNNFGHNGKNDNNHFNYWNSNQGHDGFENSDSNNNQHFYNSNSNKNTNSFQTTTVDTTNSGPLVSFTQLQSQSSCIVPSMGDSTKFELRCIFPDANEDEDCTFKTDLVGSGTTAMLRCKPPYYNENGDMRIWVCEDGTWKGEFKSFRCSYNYTRTFSNDNQHISSFTGNSHGIVKNNNKNPTQNYPWNVPKVNENPEKSKVPPSKPHQVVEGLIPDLVESDPSDLLPTYPAWKQPRPTTRPITDHPKTIAPKQPQHPWVPSYQTSTTTTPTPKPTTFKPYQPPSSEIWSNFQKGQESNNSIKCPPLSKRTGEQLECLSKSSVPWDPTSFLVSQNDCSSPQPVGAEATTKCQQFYEASAGLTIQYRKCKEDGRWTGSENGFSCSLECGKSNPVGKIPLITNGEPTYKAQWPWHAALFFRDVREDPTKYAYICGATLITRKAVLTAAHCVTEFFSKSVKSVSEFRIDLGRYERLIDDEFVQTFQAEAIIAHPSYNPYIFDSDVAIIILKEAVTVGFHVRPICYPQTENSAFEELQLSDGSVGTVVGFGKNEKNELSDRLQMAKLKVINQQECAESFSDTNSGATLTKSTTFCAGLNNGTNVCSGDSGGGMYFPVNSGTTSRWYLQGLVSVGISSQDGNHKCDPTRNSIFTRVSKYADWILKQISESDAV